VFQNFGTVLEQFSGKEWLKVLDFAWGGHYPLQSGIPQFLVGAIREAMKGKGERIVLDLEEITLVDLDVVRFLGVSEAEGVELVNCSPYIRDWIFRERNTEEED